MRKEWTKDEEELLKAFIDNGWLYQDIANELCRSIQSIKHKASRLPEVTRNIKTTLQYIEKLKIKCPTMVCLGEYVNSTTKILHKCILCNIEYKSIPNSKLRGMACKYCGTNNNGGGVPTNKQGITYLVYIPKYDLYKIGVTSKLVKERMMYNNIKPRDYELIIEHIFDSGNTAMELEKNWKENLKEYLVNTGILKSGNTETFRIPNNRNKIMLIRPLSDIHLEFSYGNMRLNKLPTDKDTVLIIAGDVGLASKPHTYLDFFKDKADRFRDVIVILGNHEHYKGSFSTSYARMKDTLHEFVNVHVMEKESIVIDDTAFIGATLWTSMANHDILCMEQSRLTMNDYRTIRHGTNAEPWKRKLNPIDTVEDHVNASHYIFKEIEKQKKVGNKAVVISHHAPSYKSVPKEFKGDTINGAYASELSEDILEYSPEVWIHGHTHTSFNYFIGKTNIICNPRGYHTESGQYLNLDFNEDLLLEV